MYSKHFGFEELPFSVTPDPRFFYSNAVYQDVLAGLEHGIEARNGFIVVTGEAGTGKTTLLHRLVSSSVDTIEYSLIINPRLSFIPILRTILKNLGLPSSSTDRETLSEQLNSHLREQFTKGRTVALLFDEAQGLSDEVLEELRLLCNQEVDGATLASIVLMGQPELERRLDHSKLRQIKQRITSRRRLTPLQDPDVRLYVASKLEHVGYTGDELFEPAAIERIISWSSGIPRLINTICDNALLLACQSSERRVTAGMIDKVANHLRLVERPPRAHQENIDEVAIRLRLVERSQRASQKKIDEVGDQPRFVGQSPIAEQDAVANQARFDDQPPVEDQREIDEVANQLRLGDRPPIEDQEKIDEVGDQPRFVGRSPIIEKIDVVANQPRFDDQAPVEDQRKIDEVANQLRLSDHSQVADQKRVDEVGDQPRFDDQPPVEDQREIDEVASQLRSDDWLPNEDQEKTDEAVDQPRVVDGSPIAEEIDAVANQARFDDQPPVEDQSEIDEVASQLRFDDRLPIQDQEKIDEVANQPRFDDQPPVENQSEIDGVASQLRFDDRPPIEEQRKIDEAVNQLRFIDHSPVADQKRVDEVGDQPRFDDQPPVENQSEIDEVANQLRFIDHSQVADQKRVDEVGDQPRFDDQPPVEDQREIDEVASQLRVDDRPLIQDQEKIDEAVNQLRFVDHSQVADQKRVDEVGDQPRFVDRSPIAEEIDAVANQPRFDDQSPVEDQIAIDKVANQLRLDDQLPIEDQKKIDEAGDQPHFDDRLPIEDQRKIDEAVNQLRLGDHSPVADQGRVDEVANQLRVVDDRSAGSDQKPMPENEQPQKLDIAFPIESVEPGSIIDDNARGVSDQLIPPIYRAKTVGRRNYQLSQVNRLRISIGALMILVVVAGGLAVFYPRQREAAVPGVNKYAESSRAEVRTAAAPAKPAQVDTNPVAEEEPQLASNSPPPSPVVQQDRDQKDAGTAKKQNRVEVANVDKLVRPVSEQIYRVSGPSFLRNRPTANAEIVDTLRPGIRIAIISRSGEYFRVRLLGDANVFGFVHKEDAFFERIQ